MRAVTFTLGQPDGSHIAYRMFGADSNFEREQIYHLNVLADETVILLGRLRGDTYSDTVSPAMSHGTGSCMYTLGHRPP